MHRPTWLNWLLALATVTAVATAGLMLDPLTVSPSVAAPPSAVQAQLDPALPLFAGAYEEEIGDELLVNGHQVSLRWFSTDEPAEQVADFYETSFRRLGPNVRRLRHEDTVHVSTLADDGRLIGVMVVPTGSGSQVIPSVSSGPAVMGAELAASDLPLPPGVAFPLSHSARDKGVESLSAQFLVSLSSSELQQFYAEKLEARGLTRQAGGPVPQKPNAAYLRYVGRGETVTVTIGQVDDGHAYVHLLSERPAADPEPGDLR